ncbi:MAG TPA: SCP2 sterol-binding domain-containing protein [Acidimicrobiales bacterium]|nr:SCP2 sterol-binding domain-containing protein [Acidimicrobiales bacterium]
MARYLSPEWVQAFDAALSALDLSDAVAAAGEGSLAAADGVFSVAQLVHDVPADLGLGAEVRLVLTVAGGRAHLTLDTDDALGAQATATIALAYPDALDLALGRLDAADALAEGRVRVRGDLAALVAGQEVLAAAAGRLGTALDELTDPVATPASPDPAAGAGPAD